MKLQHPNLRICGDAPSLKNIISHVSRESITPRKPPRQTMYSGKSNSAYSNLERNYYGYHLTQALIKQKRNNNIPALPIDILEHTTSFLVR